MSQVVVYKNVQGPGAYYLITNGDKHIVVDSGFIEVYGKEGTGSPLYANEREFVDQLFPYAIGDVVNNDPFLLPPYSVIIDSRGYFYSKTNVGWYNLEAGGYGVKVEYPATISRIGSAK